MHMTPGAFEPDQVLQRSPSSGSNMSSYSDSSSLADLSTWIKSSDPMNNTFSSASVNPLGTEASTQSPRRFPSDGSLESVQDLLSRIPQRKLHTWGDTYASDDEIAEDMISTYPPASSRFGQESTSSSAHPILVSSANADEPLLQEYFSALSSTALLQTGPTNGHVPRDTTLINSPSSPSSSLLISAPIATALISLNSISHAERLESITRSPPRPDVLSHHFTLGTASNISSSPNYPLPSSATACSLASSSFSAANAFPHTNSVPTNCSAFSSISVVSGTPTNAVYPSSGVMATPGSSSSAAANAANTRPASVGPMKIHRRQKSGKRVPPPPFSSELLKAVRLRLDRMPSTSQGSCASNPASSTSPLASPNSTSSQSHAITSSSSTSSLSSGSASGSSPRSSYSLSKLYAHSPCNSSSSCTSSSSFVSSSSSGSLATHSSNESCIELPNEVWTRIFAFLPPHCLLEMQSVCHSWSLSCWGTVKFLDLCGKCESQYSPTAWLSCLPKMSAGLRSLVISSDLPTNDTLALLGASASLESLSIHCDANTSITGLMHLTRLPRLSRLALWIPPSVRPSVLQPILPHLGHLHYFKLETLRKHFCERAFTTLECMLNLRVLDLSWCKHVNPNVFQRIAKLKNLETLILDMCGCEVTVAGISYLVALPKLADLSLKWCDHITDAVLPYLQEFPSLARLDVSFCKYLTAKAIAIMLPNISVSRAVPYSPHHHH